MMTHNQAYHGYISYNIYIYVDCTYYQGMQLSNPARQWSGDDTWALHRPSSDFLLYFMAGTTSTAGAFVSALSHPCFTAFSCGNSSNRVDSIAAGLELVERPASKQFNVQTQCRCRTCDTRHHGIPWHTRDLGSICQWAASEKWGQMVP